MKLAVYVGLQHRAEQDLAEALEHVATANPDEVDVRLMCERLARQCRRHVELLEPIARDYGEETDDEPDQIRSQLFRGPREGGIGLLRDLNDLYLMASECDISWTLIGQAAQGARDGQLLEVVNTCEQETASQLAWIRGRMKEAAPQALLVPS